MSTLLWILGPVLVLTGIAGTVIPVLPGILFVFAGLVVTAWADGFVHVGWVTIAILAVLTILSFGVDIYATKIGVRKAGASKLAFIGAVLGTLAGMFFGFAGLIIGPFAGAFLGEYIARRDLKQAGKAGAGTYLGLALAMAAKIAMAFMMVGIFVLAWIL